MQRTNAKKVLRQDTPPISRGSVGRKQISNEHSQIKQATSAVELPGFHLLAKQLKSKSMLEIEHAMGETLKDRTISNLKVDYRIMIDTEAKRLKVIEDLYAIVKAQPIYKNLKEPVWTEHTHTIEVIQWLCKKLSPLAKGNCWFIDKRMVNGKQQHAFVVIDFFHSQRVDYSWFRVPLEFLPLLAKKDIQLHDIVLDGIALTVKHKHVKLWDEYYFSKKAIQVASEYDSIREKNEDNVSVYTTGEAAKYAKLIRTRAKVVTIDSINKLIKNYTPDSERKRLTIFWVKDLMNLNKWKERIEQFDWYPHYAKPKQPLVGSFKYSFYWSIHTNDVIKTICNSESKIDKSCSGEYLPANVSVTFPNEQYKEPSDSLYPEYLHDTMKLGFSVFVNRFEKYYFKDSFSEKYPLSLQLLNKAKYATKRNQR